MSSWNPSESTATNSGTPQGRDKGTSGTTSTTNLEHGLKSSKASKQKEISSPISIISLSSRESPKNVTMIDLTSDNDVEMNQPLPHAHSVSSELTEVSSDRANSTRNDQMSSDGRGNNPSAAGDTSSSSSSSSGSSTSTSSSSPHSEQTPSGEDSEEDDEDGPFGSSKKGPPRDDRLHLRDILNKKLEQLFTKAGIELTPYGRIPWTRLGEQLSARQMYISGFPEDLGPRVVNDALHPGSAPSTWGTNRSKPLIKLIDDGMIHILKTPPGRRVLFELVRPDDTKFDSTLGYSNQWLHKHMPTAFPSVKRPRSEISNKGQSSQPQPKGKGKARQEESEPSSSQSESSSDTEDRSVSWLPHRKRPRLAESSSPSLNDVRPSRASRRASIQTRITRHSAAHDGANTKAKNKNQPIKQGEKWKEGGIVKKVGRGWIVVEESTDEEEEGGTEETNPMEEGSTRPHAGSTGLVPAPPPDPTAVPSPEPTHNSQKRKRSEPPESLPRKRINTSNANIPSSSPNDVLSRISRLIHNAGYTGNKKLPWTSLPEFLASKNLYITGFPSTCLPEVNNDEVLNASSPTHWKPSQRTAMEEAFKKDRVKVLSRPPGRTVLFEVIDSNKPARDSMLSYSNAWTTTHIKDSSTSLPTEPTDSGSATSSPTSATRPKPPSLKIVIPDTGERLGDKRSNPAGSKPPPPRRKDALQPEKAEKLVEHVAIPRADLPTPVIFLQPPTPPQEKANTLAPEKLQLDDPSVTESPRNIKSTSDSDTPKSPKNLNLPPSPSTDDPVSRPSSEDVRMGSPEQGQAQPSQKRVAKFTFKIPPAKRSKSSKGKQVVKHRKTDTRAADSDSDSSPLTDESMSIDRSMSSDGAKGYDLSLMFDSPSRENPEGGLPTHLQPKVTTSRTETSMELVPAKGAQQALVKQTEVRRPTRLLDLDQEIVAVIKTVARAPLDTKNAVEKHVRPALVKLFDAAGLSSPSTPLPWVMLPSMLCRNRLFISGFPAECLPKVTRDKVEGHCGPRSWSFSALQAMYYALRAGEVKIRRRPKGRRVLFHLLPTDAQRERGDYQGTDMTLSFSKTWLDEHMIDDDYIDDFDEDMNMTIEPGEEPIRYQRPALPPLKRESVWERFGKIKINEDSTDSEDERVPDPPWKRALEEFTRPIAGYENVRSSSLSLMKLDDGSNGLNRLKGSDNSNDSDNTDSDSVESAQNEESDDDPTIQFPINRLLPTHVPQAFQGKGRILLGFGDILEWFPNDPYATDIPPTRLVWNAKKMKWKLLPETRLTLPVMKKLLAASSRPNNGGMDGTGEKPDTSDSKIPNRVSGRVLSKGVCEHNPVRGVWECSFVGRETFGNLWWAADVGAWEWTLEDPDGRRKWLSRESPERIYSQIEKMEKVEMNP